jgi:hypothetical protein
MLLIASKTNRFLKFMSAALIAGLPRGWSRRAPDTQIPTAIFISEAREERWATRTQLRER